MKLDPLNSCSWPYVTGHKYRLSFGEGIDWTSLTIDLSKWWNTTDSDITFVMNHTEIR